MYYFLFVASLLVPNIVLGLTATQSLSSMLANLLFPLGLYLSILAYFRRPGKGYLFLLPLILVNAFQLVQLTIFSGSIIAVDMLLNLFASDSEEAGELLANLLLPIILVLALYIPLITSAVLSLRSEAIISLHKRIRSLKIGLIILALSLPLVWQAGQEGHAYSIKRDVYPVSVGYNMYLAGQKLLQVASYDETSADFDYKAQRAVDISQMEPEVYVLMIGETSRACNWSLYGYERETNPRLSKRASELVVLKDMLTQSNTTYRSVPIILSPADADHADDLPRVKGILTAMKQAGFHTIYLSNQTENRSFLDFFAAEADEHHALRKELKGKSPIYDTDMLPYLDKALEAGHPKLLIVMHGYGSHFNYRDRYPRDFAHFSEDRAWSASKLYRTELVNAYDNAIRFTDYFIDEVIVRLERSGVMSSLMYISDHGEDIFDDERERILHSSPTLSYYQLHIPALLWFSPLYREHFADKVAAAQVNEAKPVMTNSVFHTMLDMASIATPYRMDSLSILSPRLNAGERAYLNDRYEREAVSELSLSPLDDKAWVKHGLSPRKAN